MTEAQQVGDLDLDRLTESEVSRLLGVHVTTVRRWHKHNGLPQHGERGSRRYKWPEVLDWHLLYRVRTASAGGAQEGVLASEMADVRKAASKRATAAEAAAAQIRMKRQQATLQEQLKRLQMRLEDACKGSPRRRRLRSVR